VPKFGMVRQTYLDDAPWGSQSMVFWKQQVAGNRYPD
jgi:hypothetical protein